MMRKCLEVKAQSGLHRIVYLVLVIDMAKIVSEYEEKIQLQGR